MDPDARRPVRVPRWDRPSLLVLSFLTVVGCIDDTASGRVLSPPGGGNRTFFSYEAVATSGRVNCALANGGRALCWGMGALGDGRSEASDDPVGVTGATNFRALSHSGAFGCGVSTAGVGWCWGANLQGSLGDGSDRSSSVPVQVETTLRFATIATGGHTCAIDLDGFAHCWGRNGAGQLGIASADTLSLVPAPVAGGLRWEALSAGSDDTCGLAGGGEAYCWGEHWATRTPTPVPTPLRFAALDADGRTTCALTVEGEAYCWGSNDEGQLGNGERDEDGSSLYQRTPFRVETDLRFSALGVGDHHACGIDVETGNAWCWGSDSVGQLGDGGASGGAEEGRALVPTRVALSRAFATISAGLFTTCAVTTGSEAYCWGWHTGNPGTPVSDLPVRVGG